MGLLEDAIREHLELKRLRGADPGEVAREQREALEPPTGEQPAASTDISDDHREDAPPHPGDSPPGDPAPSEASGETLDGGELPSVGEETAEIDMQAVLEDDHGQTPGLPAHDPDLGSADPGASREGSDAEDPLEWEAPERNSSEPRSAGQETSAGNAVRPSPEQGRLSL
jgi:hypothetical protein